MTSNPQEDFERLLTKLDSDRDRAAARYTELHCRIAYYCGKRGCSVAEELADDTLSRIAAKLAAGEEIHTIERYSFGVAKNVLKEYWSKRGKEVPEVRDTAPEPSFDPRADEREREADLLQDREHKCMRGCLRSLPRDEQRLVKGYVKGKKEELASSVGMSLEALRVKVFRIRRRLKECVRLCLQQVAVAEI